MAKLTLNQMVSKKGNLIKSCKLLNKLKIENRLRQFRPKLPRSCVYLKPHFSNKRYHYSFHAFWNFSIGYIGAKLWIFKMLKMVFYSRSYFPMYLLRQSKFLWSKSGPSFNFKKYITFLVFIRFSWNLDQQ